ncbi:hypothetical protein CLU96_4216 [Chryseobacterium sp. 52]|nr:hypothetical protein CLU96_4216 [Chryseobacterium sp. 52]
MDLEEINQTKILELLIDMKFVITPILILKKWGFLSLNINLSLKTKQ